MCVFKIQNQHYWDTIYIQKSHFRYTVLWSWQVHTSCDTPPNTTIIMEWTTPSSLKVPSCYPAHPSLWFAFSHPRFLLLSVRAMSVVYSFSLLINISSVWILVYIPKFIYLYIYWWAFAFVFCSYKKSPVSSFKSADKSCVFLEWERSAAGQQVEHRISHVHQNYPEGF